MRKTKIIVKQPKDKNSTTPEQESSEDELDEDQKRKNRNKNNAQLTRIKERLLKGYLKDYPLCIKKMVGQAPGFIKMTAMKCGLIDFSQAQLNTKKAKELKLQYYSLENNIPQVLRTSFLYFICNLLGYSEQQLFITDSQDLMDHQLKPENQNLVEGARQLIKEVEQILIKEKIGKSGDPFCIKEGICNINMEDEKNYDQRVSNRIPINKLKLNIFLLLMVGLGCICAGYDPAIQSNRMLQSIAQVHPFTFLNSIISEISQPTGDSIKSPDNREQSTIQQDNNLTGIPPELQKMTNFTEQCNLSFEEGVNSSKTTVVFLYLIIAFMLIYMCLFSMAPSLQKARTIFSLNQQDDERQVQI